MSRLWLRRDKNSPVEREALALDASRGKLPAMKQVRRCCKYVLLHFRKQGEMINLNEVGAFASTSTEVQFGVYLPGIEPQDGYEVLVRVIHKDDRFVPPIH